MGMGIAVQGCSPKKEVEGRLKQDLDKDFLNNSGLHTRTLTHVRKILLYGNYLTLRPSK